MKPPTIHAALPGSAGHRTSTTRCPCDPDLMLDINEPGRVVVVHRPPDRPSHRVPSSARAEGGRSPCLAVADDGREHEALRP